MGTWESLSGPKMKQVAVVALVLVGCMEVSLRPAPQPFLLNFLLNHHAERRNGKSISNDAYEVPPVNDAYGAPEVKDEYGAPEVKDDYAAPEVKDGYIAPDTSTSSSYQATTTAAPSYNSPKKHFFPDILGFIGNLIKHKQQETSYTAPEESSYEAPEASSYDAPEETSYEAPETDSYKAPEEASYSAPEESSYEAPEKPTFIDLVATYEEPESSYNEPEITINERANLLQ